MESNRAGHRLSGRRRQAGITLIGMLFLAAVFGAIGLAVLKIVPLYLVKMRVDTVLEDVQTELGAGSNTIQSIRNALEARFYIENVKVERDEIEIARQGEGYRVAVNKESRTQFFGDLWFVVVIDSQIEIGL